MMICMQIFESLVFRCVPAMHAVRPLSWAGKGKRIKSRKREVDNKGEWWPSQMVWYVTVDVVVMSCHVLVNNFARQVDGWSILFNRFVNWRLSNYFLDDSWRWMVVVVVVVVGKEWFSRWRRCTASWRSRTVRLLRGYRKLLWVQCQPRRSTSWRSCCTSSRGWFPVPLVLLGAPCRRWLCSVGQSPCRAVQCSVVIYKSKISIHDKQKEGKWKQWVRVHTGQRSLRSIRAAQCWGSAVQRGIRRAL